MYSVIHGPCGTSTNAAPNTSALVRMIVGCYLRPALAAPSNSACHAALGVHSLLRNPSEYRESSHEPHTEKVGRFS